MERDEITADYAPGTMIDVEQHDGTVLRLRKLEADYDPSDRAAAVSYLMRHQAKGDIVTGLLFVDPNAHDLHEAHRTVDTPLNELNEAELVPSLSVLEKINAGLR